MEDIKKTAEKVKEGVKESLLGVEEDPQLLDVTRAEFARHATKDEDTGELYMTEKEFVDAVAPEGEDYVSIGQLHLH
jgi:solute carrier family 25 aspartate/glutamate transporter 12/13